MQKHLYQLLIVDSENDRLATYQNYLTKQGFIVDVAHDGVGGLKKLREGCFDVALVEIKLPKMNGIEMIAHVIAEELDTEMIVLSKDSTKEDAVAALNLGVGAWFEKVDINLAKLLERIKELCQVIPPEMQRRFLSIIPD